MNSIAENLTKEKSLWQIYRSSRVIPISRFNFWSTLSVFLLLYADIYFGSRSTHAILSTVRHYAESGLGITISVLGFLIAGYTIFATITDIELSKTMATKIDPKTGLDFFKLNHFNFLRTFIYCFALCMLCFCIVAFGQPNGLIATALNRMQNGTCFKYTLAAMAYCTLFAGYYLLLVQLKTFLFNIYHAVATSIRWSFVKK